MANILVCGGAGYIGSHIVRAITDGHKHRAIVLDNLSMGHSTSLPPGVTAYTASIADADFVKNILIKEDIDAVMHFAALWAVGDSVSMPLQYYGNNVAATLQLLEAMVKCGIRYFVFSSSAAVYGIPEIVPIPESAQLRPINPYGRTKLIVESVLADCLRAYQIQSVCLRYFNAAGAHPSGEIGEDHSPESHLIPLVLDVALGKRDSIKIFGNDYPTRDGTCVRDYVHVCDLADAHLAALDRMLSGNGGGIFNLGSGEGVTVREVIESCRRITNHPIPALEEGRRAGDPPSLIADSKLARATLGWTPRFEDIDSIVASAWRWHTSHPNGYRK